MRVERGMRGKEEGDEEERLQRERWLTSGAVAVG